MGKINLVGIFFVAIIAMSRAAKVVADGNVHDETFSKIFTPENKNLKDEYIKEIMALNNRLNTKENVEGDIKIVWPMLKNIALEACKGSKALICRMEDDDLRKSLSLLVHPFVQLIPVAAAPLLESILIDDPVFYNKLSIIAQELNLLPNLLRLDSSTIKDLDNTIKAFSELPQTPISVIKNQFSKVKVDPFLGSKYNDVSTYPFIEIVGVVEKTFLSSLFNSDFNGLLTITGNDTSAQIEVIQGIMNVFLRIFSQSPEIFRDANDYIALENASQNLLANVLEHDDVKSYRNSRNAARL